MRKSGFLKRMAFLESTGFLAVVAIMWLDEILDLPHHLFGFQATPINWVEGLIETVMVVACAGVVLFFTRTLVRQLKTLRGLLPICCLCHKIRDDGGDWRPVESYVKEHSEAEFSHGICPVCAQQHYGDFLPPEGKSA
jgi:hypothetical protein